MARSNTAKQLPAVSETHNLDSKVSTAGIVELLAAGATLAGPILTSGYRPQLLVPDGYQALDIPREDIAPLPDHIRGSVTLNDQESFVDYVNRYKTTNTLVFATSNTGGGSFTAVFDYHSTGGGLPGDPGRLAHTATYPCPLSNEWGIWMAKNEKGIGQEDFADFIDANSRDITKPSSASIMELAMNFEMKADVQFQSDIRRSGTGGRVLKFTETIEAGKSGSAGEIKIPEELEIAIPVFEGGQRQALSARLEWKAPNGRLIVTYHLRRPQDAIREALAGLRASIQEATGIKPMSGVVGK